jgi:hypothetical protein
LRGVALALDGPGHALEPRDGAERADANVFLLRIGAGKALANHTHSGLELTHVMCGSFHDGRALFAAGDFDAADGGVRHQPVLEADGEMHLPGVGFGPPRVRQCDRAHDRRDGGHLSAR